MAKLSKIASGFAILDVTRGRVPLRRHFGVNATGRRSKRMSSNEEPIPVIIRGHIVRVWGGDDGISQEFEVKVDKVTIDA